jgi:peroxiredoxin
VYDGCLLPRRTAGLLLLAGALPRSIGAAGQMTGEKQDDFNRLPQGLPVPTDDGACRHLRGMSMPQIALQSTSGRSVDLSATQKEHIVVYCYPRTGRPGEGIPAAWNEIPGARGCTPESCSFRDHFGRFAELHTVVFGLSTQTTEYQREMVNRLHLPFEVLSDAELRLTHALRLPTFDFHGMTLIKRLTLIVFGGKIENVFYPVFPPDTHAVSVLRWIEEHGHSHI